MMDIDLTPGKILVISIISYILMGGVILLIIIGAMLAWRTFMAPCGC
jgi:hypothetical protein